MSEKLSICKPCEKKLLETKDLNEHFGADIIQNPYKSLLRLFCPGFMVDIYGSKISMSCTSLLCLFILIICIICLR